MLYFYRYRFTYRIVRPVHFSHFIGPDVRHLISGALQKINKKGFELLFGDLSIINNQSSYDAKPFVLILNGNTKNYYSNSESLIFEILLIGKTNCLFPDIADSAVLIEKFHIGKQPKGQIKLELIESIDANSKAIPILGINQALCIREKDIFTPVNRQVNLLKLQFNTPLYIKKVNNLQQLSFEKLVNRIYNRYVYFVNTYCLNESDSIQKNNYREILNQAESIIVDNVSCQPYQVKYFSKSKQKVVRYNANYGSITFLGNLTQFIPLLNIACQFNIGSATTFGLGKISLHY